MRRRRSGRKPLRGARRQACRGSSGSKSRPIRPAVRVPLEEYVRGTILSEFAPPSGDPGDIERMLEVQAVIARTYAVAHVGRHQREGYDLCSTTHCQLYQPGRLKTSSWARARRRSQRAHVRRKFSGSTAPRPARSFTPTAAATPVPPPTSGAARRARTSRASPTTAPPASAHVTWRYEVAPGRAYRGPQRRPPDARRQAPSRYHGHRSATAAASAAGRLEWHARPVVRGEELRAVLSRAFGAKVDPQHALPGLAVGSALHLHRPGLRPRGRLVPGGAYARLKAGARPEQVLARYYPGTRLIVTR